MSEQAGAFAFPIFVEVRDRTVLVAGGGHEAISKARTLAGLGARVTSWAPEAHATRRLEGIDGIRRLSGPSATSCWTAHCWPSWAPGTGHSTTKSPARLERAASS